MVDAVKALHAIDELLSTATCPGQVQGHTPLDGRLIIGTPGGFDACPLKREAKCCGPCLLCKLQILSVPVLSNVIVVEYCAAQVHLQKEIPNMMASY
jgi:hypothetical protein